MFGTFRFILSILVVVTHMYYPYWFGHYAVFGFFILSGYLMTLVVNQRYLFNISGISRFIVNRILRIYPIYYAIGVLGIILIYYIPNSNQFNSSLNFPTTSYDWISNIFILGLKFDSLTRVVPPSWALANELFFYILICFFLGRKQFIAVTWFVLSAMWVAYALVADLTFNDRYFSLFAASLPFSVGAMFYYYNQEIVKICSKISWFFLFLFTLYVFFAPILILLVSERSLFYFFITPHGLVMYLNILLMLIWIGKLSIYKTESLYIYKIDKFLGDLSYPIYLVHWTVGLLIAFLLFGNMERGSILLMILCILFSIIFSSILVFVIERPMEVIRHKFRS